MVTMTRTTPVRLRTSVAHAVKELSGVDSVSDVASFLLILLIFQNEDIYGKLSPQVQRELGAELIDLFGDFFKIMALGMREEGLTLTELMERVEEARK